MNKHDMVRQTIAGLIAIAPITGELDYGSWFRGILAGFIGGGASAFSGGLSTLVIDPAHFNFAHPGLLLETMAGMFLVTGTMHMMAYLSQKPIPDIITTTKTETITHPPDPEATSVKTTVEETKVTKGEV